MPLCLLLNVAAGSLQAQTLLDAVDSEADQIFDQVAAWRRDIHQHPELGCQEFRMAKLIAAQLGKLGMEVETGIAYTGVVGILRGDQPGPVVALRADIDALPVAEKTGLPFASKVTTTYAGEEVGALHAAPIGTGAEDFAFFTKQVPGVLFTLGAAPQDRDPAPNHSPLFTIGEAAMRVGVRAMTNVAAGYLLAAETKK